MAESEAPGGDSGVDHLVSLGNEMAEVLRTIIANPIVRIQDAAQAAGLVDQWRKATTNYYSERKDTNVENRHDQE